TGGRFGKEGAAARAPMPGRARSARSPTAAAPGRRRRRGGGSRAGRGRPSRRHQLLRVGYRPAAFRSRKGAVRYERRLKPLCAILSRESSGRGGDSGWDESGGPVRRGGGALLPRARRRPGRGGGGGQRPAGTGAAASGEAAPVSAPDGARRSRAPETSASTSALPASAAPIQLGEV